MKKFLKIVKIFSVALIILIFLTGVYLIININYCANTLVITNYTYQTNEISTNLRYVFISDLHNKEFGENNCDLVNKIKDIKPDFITVGGDMVTNDYVNDEVMKNVLTQFSEIAPTYCVLGNHELDLAEQIDFEKDINETGAMLLDNESVIFEKDNEKIIIGGLSDYPFYEFNGPDYDVPERYLWDDFTKAAESDFSILLHHQPEYIGGRLEDTEIDLVMCGHTHGGLIQIPFLGGLVAPNQGLFPEYDLGEYTFDDTTMIVSAGLSVSNWVPRINNPAEICVVEIN